MEATDNFVATVSAYLREDFLEIPNFVNLDTADSTRGYVEWNPNPVDTQVAMVRENHGDSSTQWRIADPTP